MSYEDREVTAATKAYGFEAQLREEILSLHEYGTNGLHENKIEKGALKQDATTRKKYFNFWMGENIIQLGCELESKNRIPPTEWATWMSNAEIEISESKVTIRCPNAWRAIELEKKYKKPIAEHYGIKVIKFVADNSLDRNMRNL